MMSSRACASAVERPQLVADGGERLWAGVEARVRQEVEAAYAAQWNAAGIFERWRLRRRIEREIEAMVRQTLANVSSESLF